MLDVTPRPNGASRSSSARPGLEERREALWRLNEEEAAERALVEED
jgi:hypothetical protein